MTLALAPGSVVAGAKRIEFRFNRTDGVVSGFRVLAFNFLQIDGERVLPRKHFSRRIRSNGPPPLTGQKEIAEGQRLWQSASLRASSLAGAPAIRAHCGDCHARDGSDLKYFNYSNQSIIARSQFHGRRLRRLTKRTAGPVPDCNPFTAERHRRMEGDV